MKQTITYEEIRKKLQDWSKYPGCVNVARSPLIHRGFPGTFNLSYGEYPILENMGGYVDFEKDFPFTVIQSCIRPQDIDGCAGENSWKYLGVFEMADVAGCSILSSEPSHEELVGFHIKNLIDFVTSLGINPNKIYPTYCAGGNLSEITAGKYNFEFYVPEDSVTKNAFIACGVPAENLIPDKTRNTFLSLHLHQPTGWGYRNEIHVDIGENEKNLLDIATVEYWAWKPKYKNRDISSSANIIGLEEYSGRFAIAGIGVERICMAVNKLNRVQDVDYIKPFYDEMELLLGKKNIHAGESLRTLHRLMSDLKSFNLVLTKNRKHKTNAIVRNIPASWEIERIRKLLVVHAESQKWHDNLEGGIEPTLRYIENYRTIQKQIHGEDRRMKKLDQKIKY